MLPSRRRYELHKCEAFQADPGELPASSTGPRVGQPEEENVWADSARFAA